MILSCLLQNQPNQILDLRTLVADGPIESVSLDGWLVGHLHSWNTALTIS